MSLPAACIVGVGETAYARRGALVGEDEVSLAATAIRRAAEDAGLPLWEIDGLASYGNEMRGETAYGAAQLQRQLGLHELRHASYVWTAGGGGACAAVAHAADAVKSGRARQVAVVRALRQTADARYGRFNPERPFFNSTAPFGAFAPAPLFALQAQRYLHETGALESHLGEVAVACRQHAARNPRALLRERALTLADHAASPYVAEPLRRADCCLESDGAAAVIVTSRERARDLAQPLVSIAAAQQSGAGGYGPGPLGGHGGSAALYARGGQHLLAQRLFAEAGAAPQDVQVAQFYDAFTSLVLLALEDFGFCERGGAGAFAAAGELRWPHGRLPVNTAGGHLAEAYVHGMNLIVEAVRQVRGHSTAQLADVRLALVASAASLMPTSALLLARE